MKPYIITGILLAAFAIVLGAFGAHAWKEILGERISTFSLANDYHLWHAMALVLLALVFDFYQCNGRLPLSLILVGSILFSGSLYMLSFPSIFSGIFRSILGPITPIGGLVLIAGWVLSAVTIYRK